VNPAPTEQITPPTRRERKKRETRAALEAAALRLFAQQGYDATTVEEIAEAADVAVRTFFRYFSSKQDVLFGDVARDVTGRMHTALAARPETETPIEAIGAAMSVMSLADPEQQRGILDRLHLVDKLPELVGTYHMLFQQLHDVIAEYVCTRTGDRITDLYPQLVAAAATGSMKAALTAFEASEGQRGLEELRDDAYARLTAGLLVIPPAS
jgi:AcrR family transcriptional regulator